MKMEAENTTVDDEEIKRFSRISAQWWDESGKFAPLHSMNPVRIEYIRSQILEHFHTRNETLQTPLTGINLLDIGCGGGLLAEPMARLGARVTAIDASEQNIAVAKLHAEQMILDIDYRCTTAENLATTEERFDVILAMEIVEHVADVSLFIKSSCALLKADGIIILSTLNRTLKSYALAIVGAEYIMRLLPIGTHTWNKFLRPSELCRELEVNNLEVSQMTGMVMNPLTRRWHLDRNDLSVDYMVVGRKS